MLGLKLIHISKKGQWLLHYCQCTSLSTHTLKFPCLTLIYRVVIGNTCRGIIRDFWVNMPHLWYDRCKYTHSISHRICARHVVLCFTMVISSHVVDSSHVIHSPILFRIASLGVGQSYDCHTAIKETLNTMVIMSHYYHYADLSQGTEHIERWSGILCRVFSQLSFHVIYGVLRFQITYLSCDDCESMCT